MSQRDRSDHSESAKTNLATLLEFTAALEADRIDYSLRVVRLDAVMVLVTIPGQRWEIEFMRDGSIEVERFVSNGEIDQQEGTTGLLNQIRHLLG